MRGIKLVLPCLAVAALLAAPAWAGGPCCDKAKAENGWCSHCVVGYFSGITVKNEDLHKALGGKPVKEADLKCAGCKTAFTANGICEHCHVGYAQQLMYQSPVAHALARGEKLDIAKVTCADCKAVASTNGWCTKCNAGIVAGHLFKNKETYEKARAAHTTLTSAVESKCPKCAVAMVTDGECAQCKVRYKGGKKV